MSLNLIRKNSSSPFHNERERFYLQRSIVDRRGEGGAYESGGFDPDTVYNDTSAASAIIGMGKTVGASLASRTSGDINESNVKRKSKLVKRKENLETKKTNSTSDKNTDKYSKRITRVEGRIDKKTKSIKEYEERKKPTLESDIEDITK